MVTLSLDEILPFLEFTELRPQLTTVFVLIIPIGASRHEEILLAAQRSYEEINFDDRRRLLVTCSNLAHPALRKAGITYAKHASGCHAFRHLAGSIIHSQTGTQVVTAFFCLEFATISYWHQTLPEPVV